MTLLSKVRRPIYGNRKAGFLFETETGNMLSPGNLWRDGFRMVVEEMGLASVSSFGTIPKRSFLVPTGPPMLSVSLCPGRVQEVGYPLSPVARVFRSR